LNAWHETYRPTSYFQAETDFHRTAQWPLKEARISQFSQLLRQYEAQIAVHNGLVVPAMQEGGQADCPPVAALQHIEISRFGP
jgi:adenosine deaminase